ncbi:peptidylprolyl isomerase [Rubrivirga litoralis]|uniref:Peptidylprolyl isomerase n=1 Tax=Rubrivirga litoralis TaxID=3075598 RepID=A0ABU3BTP3_9BACT|nr:peptidylprolyl isomerase [Rubrivirga sp. F394]MDT0632541.1 peptidylprolyl isomerase [Rubrivirga sp. F394]
MTASRPALTPSSLTGIAALALVAVAAGCSGSRPAPDADRPGGDRPALAADGTPVVATWTADTLSLAELDTLYADAGEAVGDSGQTPTERRRDFLDRYVDFRLKVLAAREAGYDRDSAYVAEVADYRDQLAGPYFTDRRVLDAVVRDLYDKQAEEVEVSHILLPLDRTASAADSAAAFARAAALRDSIEAGLIPFAAAATRYSVDPSVRQNRGALGYLTGGRTILPFEDVAYDTPVGQIGGPVRTPFGVHLVRVTDRQARRPDIAARHILISPDSLVSPDSARALVASLRERVLAGEDFAALAREYSDDTGSGGRGGDLGTFGRGRMVAPFEQAAFGLQAVGDVSEPVETQFGWHLIQLTELPERPTYDEAYDELRGLAERLPRTAIKRRELGREFFRENGGTYDETVLREAIAALPADSLVEAIREGGFPPAQAERVFATLADSTYRVGRLAPVYRSVRFGEAPEREMLDVARLWLDDRAVDQAVAELERRDPEFARVLRSYADGVLLFRVAEDSVWTPARDDEAGLRAVFDARSGQFRFPERRRVLALRAPQDSLLRAAGALVDAGTAPAEAAAQVGGVRVDTVFVADSTGSTLDAALGLAVGGRTGVVGEARTRAVYVLDGIEPPRPKTFDEARADLVGRYQDEVEDAWEARLRARYDARTYPDRVTAPPAGGAGPSGADRQ